jgi:ATP-dependent helicase Lhr and Lhr-like helicase
LLASVFPEAQACQENIVGEIKIPGHPLINEVMKDVLTEAMDIEGLERLLGDISAGRIRCLAVDTPVPSQFSHEILNANPYAYLDDAPLEERRARAVEMRRVLPEAVLSEIGRLDPAAIEQVRADAWPDVRDAEELHDALLTLGALPLGAAEHGGPLEGALARRLRDATALWRAYFEELSAGRRAALVLVEGAAFWVAAERAKQFARAFPSGHFDRALPEVGEEAPSREDALFAMVTGWIAHSGPVATVELANLLHVESGEIEKALLRLEASGSVLRGNFTGATAHSTEWCDRRLLARIHRITVGTLRKQVEPVNPAQFMRWLLRWQHAAPSTQVLGERGTLEILQQMQGYEAPANAWERHILARRVADYDPKVLDHLSLTGAVGWGRLSPHPATLDTAGPERRRVVPTSVAPITFFVREDADWMISRRESGDREKCGLSPTAVAVVEFLRNRGASFFTDIVRATGKLKAEIETALWELVAAGLLTADGFDNLRALIDPRRRSGQGSGRAARPRHSAGRWSLLYPEEAVDRSRSIEAICWMLLRRYGVVFREVLTRETILPKWREVLMTLRRLEDRGEIRGGRFVSGFLGEQFALPVALESLRAQRRLPPAQEIVSVSAADPLNLVGIIVPGDRVAAGSGKTVTFRDGVAEPPGAFSSVLEIAAVRGAAS